MSRFLTTGEWEAELGRQLRSLRQRREIDQRTLAEQAGVSLTALRNLEGGKGATLRSLIRVLKALDRTEWLETLAPQVKVSPLQLLKRKPVRQRIRMQRVTHRIKDSNAQTD